ncbi:MAG: hypothetical protein FWD92_06210 [Methanomassiliicoccaceae archaeon]|nr:hypothetical protein [Methanomassiliicoccaceae archaeon]
MNRKLLLCAAVGALMMLVVLLSPSAQASETGAPTSDVHGISFRDGGIGLTLAILPSSTLAFSNVDWYLYHIGQVDIRVNGSLTDSVLSDGLLIVSHTYDPGHRYTVVISLDGIEHVFLFDVRAMLLWSDLTPGADVVIHTFTDSELLWEYLKVGLSCMVVSIGAFYWSYRRRRDANREGVRYG